MQSDTKTALGFVAGIVLLLAAATFIPKTQPTPSGSGVSVVDDRQTITINTKGGYNPNRVTAKAGVATDLNFTTNGTFDCSSVLVIPALNYQKTLPATGTETVSLSAAQATGTLEGQCGMGMYKFEIAFK